MEKDEISLGEIKNAIISDATITTEHNNSLTAIVTVIYGNGTQQPFGALLLFATGDSETAALQTNSAGLFISRVLKVAGVQKWEQLIGRSVRVRGNDERIEAMGHIISDDWFDPVAEIVGLKNKQVAAMPTKSLVSLLKRVRDALPVEDVALAADVTEAIERHGVKEDVAGA